MASALPLLFHRWRASPWLAHVAPLTAFLLLQGLGAAVATEASASACWWRTTPGVWLFPLQTVLSALLVAFWWSHYAFPRLKASQAALGLLTASLGIAAWVTPSALGWMDRTEGSNPATFPGGTFLAGSAVIFRFLRLVIVAPFVEEIFWRGFLQRYLVDTREDFWEIPFGTFSWISAFGTTAGVILIHAPTDWPAAAVWGALMAALYVRTKSLTACIFAHAAANLLLGIYVLRTGNWGFL